MLHAFFSTLSSLQRRIPSGVLIASFGLLLTAAAWLDVLHRESTDRASEIERIHRENGALARAFEEHVRRVVQSADNALSFLQDEFESHGRVTPEILNFVERTRHDPILSQISLADADGELLVSAVPHAAPINIFRRQHFQVHAASPAAGLFIGRPILAHASGKWTFFLSRRLSGPGGSFAGVVSAGLDPAYFSNYYDHPELGPNRAVLLVGRDGIVRARRFQRQSEVGQNLAGSPMFAAIERAPTGRYEVTGVIDSLRRFVSFRALPDLPLVVAVSDLTATALAPFRRRAAEFRISAVIFTLFVALFCLVLIRAERRTRRDNASLTAELTERRRAEEALNESQGLFAAFLDHIPAVVFVQDLTGRILYSNQAFKDLPGREAIGRNARDLLAPVHDQPPGGRPTLRGRSVALDETLVDGDGRTRIFETRMFIVDRAGKEPLLGCISVDSTGRRNAEEERLAFERRMQQTQRLESLGVLAGGVAHDFNNLLMVILGNADLALSKAAESPLRGYIANIDVAAQRASDLANQMLAYSGKGRFLIEPLNLSRLVEEMGDLIAGAVPEHVAVRYRLAGDLPSVLADATQLRQVVTNLTANASDAIGEAAGVVTIGTGVVEIGSPETDARSSGAPLPRGTYAFIEVGDTGSGMDAATQSRIFDPFYTTKQTGRGLGLPSVLGIVRGHHGEIQVASDPGQGTTIRVLLPAVADSPPLDAAAPDKPASAQQPAGTRRTILLVDDEEHVRQTAQLMLEETGFSVITAVDGVEGVELFKNQAAHLSAVVLDMNMPRMDGAAAFRQMHRFAPGVPVILTSGLDEQDAVGEFTGAGLAGFIQKPYRLKALLEKLEAAIAGGSGSRA